MRLYPAVTEEEAFVYLKSQAVALWGADSELEMENGLKSLAQAMAAISAADIPEDVEPLFPSRF